MTDLHPMVPSDKQLQHWIDKITYPHNEGVGPSTQDRELATLAYQAGADAELEACCEWLGSYTSDHIAIYFLREARRPKPPSLKEQALAKLAELEGELGNDFPKTVASLRRALEQLND